ncbi:MAG: DNA polymerase III subunit gamma/tau [Candidatus Omnitrophica bacterium]|nr:DNA polymerase III subunit gamma/tau [Candidatus Omnitrophota bacterium]MCG2706468.1 DNA polymerase III subunit gamma/tau [Candidatus Omnitrophota bacterium]
MDFVKMPYQVFALKWRPQNFTDIIGQGHIVTTLKSALLKNRLAHAYLFAGPRGVGKTSTARILAKSLNCKEGPTVNPCQKCSACLEISQGRNLDVIEIDGASNRGIDEIRTLRENVKFSPTGGKSKIYIIDEVHMLTPEAFNALLKTLEEPPEFVKFIFATTQPHKVLPTILSRCQRFDFRRIPVMETIAQLEKIVKAEDIDVDEEVLLAIARSSDGSLRDAESVLDQLVSFSKDKVSLKDVISVLGLIEQETLFAITDKIIQKDARAALELLNNIIDQGKDLGVFLTNLIEHFRNLMVAKITKADSQLIDLPEEICQRLLKQSESFSLEGILSTFNILVNTQMLSKRLESLRIPLEISLVRLSYDKKNSESKLPLPKHPVKKYFAAEEKPAVNCKESTAEPIEPPAQSISLDNIRGLWQNMIQTLTGIKMSVATYLNEGSPVKLENNVLTISFPLDYSLHKESLERKENKAIIEEAILGLCNARLRVNFILSKEAAVEKSESEDSFIKSALQMFKGRVIKRD